MRHLSPRHKRLTATRPTAVFGILALLTVGTTLLAGCDDDDVGVLCESSETSSEEDSSDFVITQSLECKQRLCILKEGAADPQARCTRVCESDGDCPGKGPNCDEGFLCRVGTQLNILGLQCCKLCICKGDLSLEERETDLQAQQCEEAGIKPSCPSL